MRQTLIQAGQRFKDNPLRGQGTIQAAAGFLPNDSRPTLAPTMGQTMRTFLISVFLIATALFAEAQETPAKPYQARIPADAPRFVSEGTIRALDYKLQISAKGAVEVEHRKKNQRRRGTWTQAKFATISDFMRSEPQIAEVLGLLQIRFEGLLEDALSAEEGPRDAARKSLLQGPVLLHLFWIRARARKAQAARLEALDALIEWLEAQEHKAYDAEVAKLRQQAARVLPFDSALERLTLIRGPRTTPASLRLLASPQRRACVLEHRDGACEVWTRLPGTQVSKHALFRDGAAFAKAQPELYEAWQGAK